MNWQVWLTYEGTEVSRLANSTAYTYQTRHVAIDADGSPRAYHPQNTGLDDLGNAGYPNRGWRSVLVVDPADPGRPYVQPDGPTAGYFVSKTSLKDATLHDTDPHKYVDAESVPYIVFPGGFYALQGTGAMGDLVMARKIGSQSQSAAIVADGGPFKAPLGEISIKLAEALGGVHPNPRTGHGAPTGLFQYVVFPGSRSEPAWRRSLADMEARAATLLDQIGGWPAL